MTPAVKLTPQQIRDENWRRGRLGFLLHPGQQIIDDRLKAITGQLFVGNIARQFGKSYWAVTKAVSLALSKPKTKIKYGTAFHTDLTEFIQPTFEAVLADCPPSLLPKYKVNGSKWIFQNGSEIKLVGLDRNPNSLRGNVIDLIIIDECGFVSDLDYIYTSIIVPATLHRPNCKIIFISTPPNTPAHSFVDFIQKAEAEGSYVKLDIYQNPRITQSDIDRMAKELGGIESTAFRRECLCELISDDNSSIIPEWHDKYVVDTQPDQYYAFYHRYVGMDLGVKDFTVALFGYYDFKRATLVILDEIKLSGPKLTTKILHQNIAAYEQRLWPDHKTYRRISDNNNLQLIQDLAIDYKMSFIPTNKEALEAMINEVRIMVGNGQIEIHPRCVQLIGCLKYGVWDAKKKAFARSKVYGHFDALAALVYLVRNLDKYANPIPRGFGFDPRSSVIKQPKHDSEGARLLQKIFHKPTRKPTF